MDGKFDFGGYATKNDLVCSDGRTIRKDAFKDCDGMEVPLVWNHKHDTPGTVLGHAILENREDGVYTYGSFNESDAGKNAKELVRHGDIKALSIYANQLKQRGSDVLHGMIREVSLCLSGANPGARIVELSMEHSDDDDSDMLEALLFNGYNIELQHAEEEKKEEAKEVASENDKKAPESEEKEETIKDIYDTLNEKQKKVVEFMIGMAVEQAAGEEEEEEEKEMSHNVFEGDNAQNSLMHAAEVNKALSDVIIEARDSGVNSLKKHLAHAMQTNDTLMHAIDTTGMTVSAVTNQNYANSVGYGINGIEMLYPDAKALNDIPEFIKRQTDWVNVVLSGVRKSPFARVKSVFANITEDEARAKGYIKANQKSDEFFSLMKRETNPQTIYKRNKVDRDDIIDITSMDVVAFIRGEMDLMLDEEKARAILVGDGRSVSSPDKIKENNVRPIVSDENLFTIKKTVQRGQTDEDTGRNIIKTALRARKDYRGSGNTILFTTDDWLTSMILIEDGIGRRLYATEAELAAAMRVRKIVVVPVMENYTNANGEELCGIIVDLNDYNVGADRGGAKEMFDDFDIDFNQYIYLIETRCSGALVKPFSAIAMFVAAASSQQQPSG